MPEKSTLQDILFTAFLAVGVKIAIEMKRTKSKISIFNIVLSMIIGVGTAYLSSGLVLKHFSNEWLAIVIAVIAILSEKIGAFLIYKFNVDIFLSAIIDVVLSTITKSRNK